MLRNLWYRLTFCPLYGHYQRGGIPWCMHCGQDLAPHTNDTRKGQ